MNIKSLFKINHIRIIATIFLLIVSFDLGHTCIAGQLKASPPISTPSNANLNELEQLIGNARDIYEKAQANHWKHLDKKINAIVKAERSLQSVTAERDMPYYKNLISVTSDLERAVSSQDRQIAMKSANKIMMIGARLAEEHNSAVPINVAVIGYFGRKLEIQSETESIDDLSDTVSKLHLSWQQLIPQVSGHGGMKEIKKFAEIMRRIESAKTPAEYGKLAPSVIDEIDIIEKIFKR